jgi:chromosome segregation ATPase
LRLEKQILELVRRRGGTVSTAGTRNIPARIAVYLGLEGKNKEGEITTTLESLADKGKLKIERLTGEGTPIRCVKLIDETNSSTETELSTVTTMVTCTTETRDVSEMQTRQYSKLEQDEGRAEQLTFCLLALQCKANPSGELTGVELRETIAEEMNFDEPTVERVIDLLQIAGVRSSKMTGFQSRTHFVRMDISEITPEMLKKQREPQEVIAEEAQPAAVSNEPQSQESEGVIATLAGIIENLESRVEDLLRQKADLENSARLATESMENGYRALVALQGQNQDLVQELASARSEIAKLQSEANSSATSDPRIASILARHGS